MRHREIAKLVAGSLLLALSIIIPLFLGGVLGVVIPPFSATLASHVPSFLAMLFGPLTAGVVGFGSALGFFFKLGPVIGARAAMHIPMGVAGALMLRKSFSFPVTLAAIAPLHAGLEALLVLFLGFSMKNAGSWLLVGAGTLLHHVVDSLIAVILWKALFARGFVVGREGLEYHEP